MKRSNRLILLIGFLLAAVAFVGVVLLLGGNKPAEQGGQQATTTKIVAAGQDIQAGTVLKAEMLTTVDVPTATKPVGSFDLVGSVVDKTITTSISQGHILTSADFATTTASSADVARLLEAGKGAIAVQVDQVTGVGTLIKPGDHVDVVLSMTEADNKNPIVVEKAPTKEGQPPATVRNFQTIDNLLNNTTVKVLVENLRVVGTLLPPPTAAANGQTQNTQNTTGTTGTTPPAPTLNGQSQIVLLEATPQQVEMIRFAQIDGNLSLVLRAPVEPGASAPPPAATTGITLRQLVDKYGVLPPKIILTEQP